jgi:hypothetical protein
MGASILLSCNHIEKKDSRAAAKAATPATVIAAPASFVPEPESWGVTSVEESIASNARSTARYLLSGRVMGLVERTVAQGIIIRRIQGKKGLNDANLELLFVA